MKKHKNIVDILLDDENKDPIALVDQNGKHLSFEQVAVIPRDKKLYCILKPIDHIDNVADDEAIVFRVDDEENDDSEPTLHVETDELTALDVFGEYYDLLDEEVKKKCNRKTS